MRLLYLTFQEDAPLYAGVLNKIRGQASAFQSLGFDVTYSWWKDNRFCFFGQNPQKVPINASHGVMKRFYEIAAGYLQKNSCDVLYTRLDRIDFGVVALFRKARRYGVKKLLIEIPNYPYLKDYVNTAKAVRDPKRRAVSTVKVHMAAAEDRMAGPQLKGLVDAAVLYGDTADTFYGVPAMNATNGIDCGALPPVPWPKTSSEIVLIGVAGTLWWQAYDRVLAGMARWRQKKDPRYTFRFLMIGGDEKEMPEFRARVKALGLEDCVEMPGFKTGRDLLAYYNRADVGVSTLGCFRRGLTRCSSLKAREYAALGLPFLYAYHDDALPGDAAWALRLPNDDTAVDMERVAAFVERCRRDPRTVLDERAYAQEVYDWRAILREILRFGGVDLPAAIEQA